MLVLGIETSCDDTGIALYDSEKGLLEHALYSQTATHAVFKGVVPELASRDHIRKTLPLIEEVLKKAGKSAKNIDGIAYTAGPGLSGALLVGASLGRALAMSCGIPAIAVHHMEGHLLAPMLEPNPPTYPFVSLLVSGGHTLLIQVTKLGEYVILGESVDDAVGEAFDKTAKLLGLGYPGGAALSKLAEMGNPNRFKFPRPMLDRPGLDFSFSGLKTCAVNTAKKSGLDDETKADIARAFQDACVDTLVKKSERALKAVGYTRLVVAGGVGANKALRIALNQMGDRLGVQIHFPRQEFCTDNGAMIAYAGCMRLLQGEKNDLAINVFPRWPIDKILS